MLSVKMSCTSRITLNLYIVFLCSLHVVQCELNAEVTIEQGTLKGAIFTSISDNSTYLGFLDVPYAKPPIGNLRFREPQSPEPWNGTRLAQNNSGMCFQRNDLMRDIAGTEDCLLLHVFTTRLPELTEDRLQPVMVWFHGGAFEKGSGFKELYGPDYLIVEGVVLVNVNYRLGPLGFLNLNHSDVSNNVGLKDQVAALRWVQKNIAKFGGDPNSVTIFGQSAGAASVHLHMLSPMSKGLFHRAIAQSGSALNTWATSKSGHERAMRLARAVGCDVTGDMQLMVDCLRNVSAEQLIANSHNHTLTEEDIRHGTRIPFVPTSLEATNNVDEVFLEGDPQDLLKEGKFHRVPFITGFNSQESIIFVPLFKSTMNVYESDFQRLIPRDIHVDSGKRSEELVKEIKEFYFANQSVSLATMNNLVNITTDLWYVQGIHKTMKLHAALSTVPVYFYEFDFNGELNFMKRIMNQEKRPGAGHCDELGYLFKFAFWDSTVSRNSPEMRTLFRLVKLWTNFAKTGDPTSETNHVMNVQWPPVTSSNVKYLHITEQLAVNENVNADRISFWDQIYKRLKRA